MQLVIWSVPVEGEQHEFVYLHAFVCFIERDQTLYILVLLRSSAAPRDFELNLGAPGALTTLSMERSFDFILPPGLSLNPKP